MPMDLLAGRKSSGLTWYLRVITWSYIILPFVTIIFWGALVMTEGGDNYGTNPRQSSPEAIAHDNTIGGASIIVLGISLMLFLMAVFKIRWNNWRFKQTHAWMLLSAYLLLTIW